MKTISGFIMFIFLLLLSAGHSWARPLQEILADGELRACFTPAHPYIIDAEPHGCRENCRYSGPAWEAVGAFAEFLGSHVRVHGMSVELAELFYDTQGRLVIDGEYTPELLASGRCDLYPNNLTRLPWRMSKIHIVTLFPNRLVVLIHTDNRERFQSISDLAGKLALAQEGTSFHGWLLEQNESTFAADPVDIRTMSTPQALEALSRGKGDFTVMDADAAFWIIRNRYAELHMAFPVGSIEELGWGLRREDKDLQEAVKMFFQQQRAHEDSTLNDIWRRYLGMSLIQYTSLLGSMQAF